MAWGLEKLGTPHKPFYIPRPNVTDYQVKFEMLYCGVCHSDCHLGKNDWGMACYPMVPGHELLGKVVEIGNKVTKFKVGDTVGVGCFIESCQECPSCKEGNE